MEATLIIIGYFILLTILGITLYALFDLLSKRALLTLLAGFVLIFALTCVGFATQHIIGVTLR